MLEVEVDPGDPTLIRLTGRWEAGLDPDRILSGHVPTHPRPLVFDLAGLEIGSESDAQNSRVESLLLYLALLSRVGYSVRYQGLARASHLAALDELVAVAHSVLDLDEPVVAD